MKWSTLFLVFIAQSLSIVASDSTMVSKEMELLIDYGRIIKHSPVFRPIITENSEAIEFSYLRRCNKKSNFLKHFNYPSLGAGAMYCHFGNNSVFGDAYGLMIVSKFYLIEKQKSSFFLRTGVGLGYLTQTYQSSYINNVIGSNINAMVNIVGGYNVFVSHNINLLFQGGITHFSNARTTKPNLGINFLHAALGVQYHITNKREFHKIKQDNFEYKRFKNIVNTGIGVSDKGNDDNRHVLPTFSINYLRRSYTSEVNALLLGGSLAYKNNNYDDKIFGFLPNSDVSFNFGDELFLGKLSVAGMLGVYLYPLSSSTKYWYQKYAINYQLLSNSPKFSPLIGIQIKTHYAAAELAEIKFGILF